MERGQQCSEHIIIGTPGTVVDWAFKFRFFDPKQLKVFVLDEADVMIDTQGHQDQSIRIQRFVMIRISLFTFKGMFLSRSVYLQRYVMIRIS